MKANSERVPNKNFRDFCGKPLFRWVLDALLSEAIDQVVINTDAREKLAALGCVDSDRVLIRDRPVDICGDFVSMNEVIADDSASCRCRLICTNAHHKSAITEVQLRVLLSNIFCRQGRDRPIRYSRLRNARNGYTILLECQSIMI